MISIKKPIAIIATIPIMNASILRMPIFCRYSNRKVSNTVNDTPQIRGRPVSNCIPIAIPRTSARSHAAMAISASPYSIRFTGRG